MFSEENKMNNKPTIIADIGSNWKRSHNELDNKEFCLKAIEVAKESGATAAKFQLFTHEELYGFPGDDNFALPREWIGDLAAHADRVGIEFMCTAFSASGYEFINQYVKTHKIASCEMLHTGILDTVIKTEKPMIISTGASTYSQINWLINYVCRPLCLLDCVVDYPAKISDYNLAQIPIWKLNGLTAGVSDHTTSSILATTAVGIGATVFEKHFDPFKYQCFASTPDTKTSVSPGEMMCYVGDINSAFSALGNAYRIDVDSEKPAREKYRRRLVATKTIEVGDAMIYGENFDAFRLKEPDTESALPMRVDEFNGHPAIVKIEKGQGIPNTR